MSRPMYETPEFQEIGDFNELTKCLGVGGVRGHDKVPVGGQVKVPAGGHLVVPGA